MNSTPTAGKRQVTLKTTLMVGLLSISAVLVGILAAQSSSLALLLLLGIIVWIALAKYYELALAALLVGFFAYPVALGLFGLAISSVKTATFYALLATAALAGGNRSPSGEVARHLSAPRHARRPGNGDLDSSELHDVQLRQQSRAHKARIDGFSYGHPLDCRSVHHRKRAAAVLLALYRVGFDWHRVDVT